jgi:hypothetical protein
MIRWGVFDDQLTEGWGVITIGCNRAHYWPNPANGVALCGYRCKGWHANGPGDDDIVTIHMPYTGQLRRERGLKTDCAHCRQMIDSGLCK